MAVSATFAVVHPSSEPALEILYRYNVDIVGRFYGREASEDEARQVMFDEPSDDLVGDSGLFVIAYLGSRLVGCGGARFVSDDVAELTRVFVDPRARGTGVGASIVEFVEESVRRSRRTTIRLDTRADLIEARGLYAKLGYREVQAFNAEPYAEVWLAKVLL